jgi:3-dehydroquinate dehydratase
MTAVEWLVDFFESGVTSSEEWTRAKKQAKEMEKEQIINTYRDGRSDQQSEKNK